MALKQVMFRGSLRTYGEVAQEMGYTVKVLRNRLTRGIPLDRPNGPARKLTESGVHEIDGEVLDDSLPYDADLGARVVVTMFQTRSRADIYQAAGGDEDALKGARGALEGALMTLDEVGAIMGISRQRVEQIEIRALRKLRMRLKWAREYESLRELMVLRDSMRGDSPWDRADREAMSGDVGYSKWNEAHSMASIAAKSGRHYDPKESLCLERFNPKGAL